MRRRSFAVPALGFALLAASCSSASQEAEGPAITVARIETTLMSDTPDELANTEPADGTDVDDTVVEPVEEEPAEEVELDVTPDEEPDVTPDEEPDDGALPSIGIPEPATKPDTAAFDTVWISFEVDDIFDEEHIIGAFVPVGSTVGVFDGEFEPPSAHPFTSISFENGCDGVCAPKDWEEALNSPEGRLNRSRGTGDRSILRDESLGDGWILVIELDGLTTIDLFRWNDDVDFHFHCDVDLYEEDQSMLDDYIKLCEAAEPQWLQ